jgi:hypothetical protein
MRAALIALGGFLAATGVAAVVLTVTSGGGEEVVVQDLPTATATQEPPTPGVGTPTSAATPSPTAAAPSEWISYSDPGGLYTLEYPPDWYLTPGQAQFSSSDLTAAKGVTRPDEAIVVEVGAFKVGEIGSCGAVSVDGDPKEGAVSATLGGVQSWTIARVSPDPAIEGNLTRIETVSSIHAGYCYNITGYFTQADPDVELFDRIVGTVKFAE